MDMRRRNSKFRQWMAGVATTGLLLSGLAAIGGPVSAAIPEEPYAGPFQEGRFVSPTLEGCRGAVDSGSYKLLRPGESPAVDNPFICDSDEYTSGNLGKGWNELDLVPHRLTTKLGEQENATTTFDLIIAGDNSNGDYEGYDRVTIPQVNTTLSSPGGECTVVGVTDEMQEPGVTGGVDDAVYRIVRLSQTKGSTCVFDFDLRLSNSSALFNGSSLQAYMFEADDFSTGKRTVPIPVKEVEPQKLLKSAAATRDQSYAWLIHKTATPTTLTNSDTCEAAVFDGTVKVDVNWERVGPAADGKVAYKAVISAENPSKRDIQVKVTDVVKADSADGEQLVDPIVSELVTVPPGTHEVLTVDLMLETDATAIYDKATGEYYDPILQQPVDPNKTVEATTPVTTGAVLNDRAAVTETEEITPGFEFRVAEQGEEGPGPYGDWINDEGKYEWSIETSDTGSQTFYKQVRTAQAQTGFTGEGTLSDTVTIQGTDGGAIENDWASVTLIADKKADITITKSVYDVFQGEESATFTFDVFADDGTGKPTGDPVKTATVTADGDSPADGQGNISLETTVQGLAGGKYVVVERDIPGFQESDPVLVDLTGFTCDAPASFFNTPDLTSATVKKVSVPAGYAGNWDFTLKSGDIDIETVTTTNGDPVSFTTQLVEGSYSIVETPQGGWASEAGPGCEFTVDLPGDGGKEFQCTYTNTYEPKVTLAKSGDELAKVGPDPVDDISYTFVVENTSAEPGAAGAPDLVCTIEDETVGFTKEVDPIGPGEKVTEDFRYALPDTTKPGTFTNEASVSCTYVDSTDVVASSSSSWDTKVFAPTVAVTKKARVDFALVGQTVTYDITIKNTSSADTPNLVDPEWTDPKAPAGFDLPAECEDLAVGASCSTSYDYVVQESDDPTADNTFAVTYSLKAGTESFPNKVSDEATYNVVVLRPAYEVTKECKAEPVNREGPAVFTITYKNTGNADLTFTPNEGEGGPVTVPAGESKSVDVTVDGPFTDTVSNTVTGTVVIAGLDIEWTNEGFTASDTCTVKGLAKVAKTVDGQPPAQGQSFTFELRSGATVMADGTTLESKTTDANGSIEFSSQLDPGETYQLCEVVMPGWNTNLGTLGTLFVPGSMDTPTLPNPNVNNMYVCIDFQVTSGETKTFSVDNSPPPGGRALTIGFWKNWASCSSGGKQDPVLDRTLAAAPAIDGGHGIVLSADTGSYPAFGPVISLKVLGDIANPDTAPGCDVSVRILDKRATDTGKKLASDPRWNLASQLLAAQLNQAAGAYSNPTVMTAINQSVLLLGKYDFTGKAASANKKLSKADAAAMNDLAKVLDDYNNNR